MKKAYESPALVELGDFHAETGFGLGGQTEFLVAIADRSIG
ncbi:keywimysin-related RiPP [Brevibacterium sp. HMSC063G07]|nr:keywimysin-related RiPP [Brevibacterium sp. HMSC063G07]